MNTVLSACMTFFTYAVAAMFAQNAIFSRGLGVSRLIQLVGDDSVSSLLFGLELCVIQLCVAPLGWLANRWLEPLALRASLRPIAYVVCVCAVCGALRGLLHCAHKLPYHQVPLIYISSLV